MKHYFLSKEHAQVAQAKQEIPQRSKHIDVILNCAGSSASAEIVTEFYSALNGMLDRFSYIVTLRAPSQGPPGDPSYWAGRTAIFWGGLENNWTATDTHTSWISQVLNLASQTVLVGDAVLLLAQYGRGNAKTAAVHPNFNAAAQEFGLVNCGAGTYLAGDGRMHSASTRLGALRLLSELVSADHGEHLADTLRGYIGLTEPERKFQSQLATRLVRRSGGDRLVVKAIEAMLDHIEDPLRISDLSEVLSTSTRQLQRRFLCKTGAKLLSTYRELRLERAHSLLQFTDLSQSEISAATGFSSSSALRRAFQDCYKIRPEVVREIRFAGSQRAEAKSGNA